MRTFAALKSPALRADHVFVPRTIRVLLTVLLLSSILTLVSPSATPVSAATCPITKPTSAFAQQVAMSPGHARVWRLYQAFFLRQPDQGGFDYWYGMRARGHSLSALAYSFSSSEEFRMRYGNLNHGQFVDLLYRNVLCRTPDAGGRAYWLDMLSSGRLTRWDMMVNFIEQREYLMRTGTCHSIFPAQSDGLAACATQALRPLSQATMANDGYQDQHVTVARVGGGSGAFRGVMVDFTRGLVETGANRCSVASINANWVAAAEKDRANPSALGIGVVDGVHVKGSSDRNDRGVMGLRFDATPKNVVEVWPGDTLSADDQKLSSVMHHRGKASLESWHAAAEMSPYLTKQHPEEIVGPYEWVWAAAGMPLIIDGQTNKNFSNDYVNDPYTLQTRNHSFVAFDQDTGRMLFGATTQLDARDLVVWARNHGWEDLVKFDGGGSTELNVGGRAVVAGTSRDLPVWLGIGC